MSLYHDKNGEPYDRRFHFCTGFDRNFLPVGYALVESLARHLKEPYVFYVLCYDAYTHETMVRLALPHVHLIDGRAFEAVHPALAPLKAERSVAEYYWTCKSTLLCDIFEDLDASQHLIFLDADHYFFDDPLPIFTEMGKASIGMVEHQFGERYTESEKNTGTYNAGFCVFRGDANARECLHWWREQTLAWCFNHTEDGKFGDQMYLNHWPEKFSGIHVIAHPGVAVAPWNMNDRNPAGRQGGFTMNGQPLILGHFHRFCTAGPRAFEPDSSATYSFDSLPVLRIYQEYARVMQRGVELTPDNEISFPIAVVKEMPLKPLLAGLFRRQYVYTKPFVFTRIFWALGGGCSRFRTEELLQRATVAFVAGELKTARKLALQCMLRNPLRCFDKDVLYILFRRTEKST